MKRAGEQPCASDNVNAQGALVNRIILWRQSHRSIAVTSLRAGKVFGMEGEKFHTRRRSPLSVPRNISTEHCAMSVRVIITIALRACAFRTGCHVLSGASSARRLPMPARETEAIILKTFPLGEADRLVSFLGRSSGRVRGVAAGARRLKNRYGSTLEVLSHVQIWYAEKETRDLVRIHQADLLESFHKAQSDYGLSTGLAVISEVSEQILPEHEVSEPMFRLILLAAREIERTGNWALPLTYFAFWTVRLGGWLPRFDRCVVCHTPFRAKPTFYDGHQAGLFR